MSKLSSLQSKEEKMRKFYIALALLLALPISIFATTPEPTYIGGGVSGAIVGNKSDKTSSSLSTVGPKDLVVGDELDVIGAASFGSTADFNGQVTFDSLILNGAQTATVVTASSDTTITPTKRFIAINANVNSITFTALPLLTAATLEDYQEYIIYCSSNDITLQDADTLTGSGIQLTEGTTLTLSKGEWCKFISVGDVLYQDGFARTLDGVKGNIGDLTVADSAGAGVIISRGFEANDGTLVLSADESDDNGDDWTLESDQATNKLIISNDTSGSVVEKVSVDTSGDLDVSGYVIAGSSNVTMVPISFYLADTQEIALEAIYADADGKAGFFDLILGTHTARGSFTAAGAVTLTTDGSGTATTSDNNDGTLNTFDNGDSVTFENQTTAAGTLWGWVSWQN